MSTVKVNLNIKSVTQILATRNMQKGGKADLFLATEIHRLSDPYTPLDNSILKENVTIEPNKITYDSPYAQYQWYGRVMAGNPRKAIAKALKYNGSLRGAHWTTRMMIDRKQDVIKAVNNFVGGKG